MHRSHSSRNYLSFKADKLYWHCFLPGFWETTWLEIYRLQVHSRMSLYGPLQWSYIFASTACSANSIQLRPAEPTWAYDSPDRVDLVWACFLWRRWRNWKGALWVRLFRCPLQAIFVCAFYISSWWDRLGTSFVFCCILAWYRLLCQLSMTNLTLGSWQYYNDSCFTHKSAYSILPFCGKAVSPIQTNSSILRWLFSSIFQLISKKRDVLFAAVVIWSKRKS